MKLDLPINAALECLPLECNALRVRRAPDKAHLPAALRAQELIIGTMGAGLFSGHNSPREFSACVRSKADEQSRRPASLRRKQHRKSQEPIARGS